MKKFLVLVLLIIGLSVNASDRKQIPYKNIKENSGIVYDAASDIWSVKKDKKDTGSWVKRVSVGTGSYSEYYDNNGEFVFSTGTQYEFINHGKLIGYSNQDLKFYDFAMVNGELVKNSLSEEEIQKLFPDYKIIKLSEFSPNTNSLKIKKNSRSLKLILFNDTDKNFYHYSFSSNNAKFSAYELTGFLEVTKKGMIQFSHFGDNTENNPWYILLVRG